MVVYDGMDFQVTNGWFRGLRVVDKRSGATIKPAHDLSHKVLTVWATLGMSLHQHPRALKRARDFLLADLGLLCIHGPSPDTGILLDFSDATLLGIYADMGIKAALEVQQARRDAGLPD